MPIMKILHRHTKECLFEADAETLKQLVEKAVKKNANLSGAYLSRANLSGANLIGANLSWANLIRANLSRANLIGANLSEANLSGAYLSEANLSGANLIGAYLSGAYLSGAYLSGANLLKRLHWELHYLRLHRADPEKIWDTFDRYLTGNQLCHSPVDIDFAILCGCEKTKYRPNACLHFTVGDCNEDEMIYCIPYDDPGLSIREHKKGECPFTEYEVSK